VVNSEVLSFGGGVNSVALAILLVNEGWRGHIVFADTGTGRFDNTAVLCYNWPGGQHENRILAKVRNR
jgi:hypothetical protein